MPPLQFSELLGRHEGNFLGVPVLGFFLRISRHAAWAMKADLQVRRLQPILWMLLDHLTEGIRGSGERPDFGMRHRPASHVNLPLHRS